MPKQGKPIGMKWSERGLVGAALHGRLDFYQLGQCILELLLMLIFSYGKVLKITEFEIGAFLDMPNVP